MTTAILLPPIYLASQSPRRAQLLQQIGVVFDTVTAAVDETPLAGESAAVYVERLARNKAAAGWRRAGQQGVAPRPVLGADTAVVLDGQILGKPRDRADALAMLDSLSGRSHRVLTGVALCRDGHCESLVCATEVWFRVVTAAEREQYWDSGEPRDKAGGYGIQGLGAIFVEGINGSYSNVVGLPLLETYQLLQAGTDSE